METIQQNKITEDTLIGEIVDKFPAAVEPLMKTGVHCIGCGISPIETLGQGLRGHGMTDEQITKIVKTLNEAVERSEKSSEGITITDKAADKIKQLLKAENREGQGFRVEVSSGGCSGLQYIFDFDESPKENDEVFEKNGAKIFINKDTLEKLKGITINYVDSLQGSGFKISNPNAAGTCGCGSSFY